MSSAIFLIAVACVLLYLVPWAVQRRAILADSTVDDRFSPHMQLLAISGERLVHQPGAARGPVLEPRSAKRRSEAFAMKRPTAPATARITAQQLHAARERRSAEIKLRNAAIKRRQILTLTLLALTVIVAGLGGASVISAWWTLLPGALLAAVLVQGRRVAISYANADRKRDRRIDELERRLGHLQARGHQTLTEIGAKRIDKHEDDASASSAERRSETADAKPAVRAAITASDVPDAVIADATWEPVAIPAPTYTLKATAVRPPLKPDADVLPKAEKATSVPMRPKRATMLNGSDADDGVADQEPVFDLDSALARRRAAGE